MTPYPQAKPLSERIYADLSWSTLLKTTSLRYCIPAVHITLHLSSHFRSTTQELTEPSQLCKFHILYALYPFVLSIMDDIETFNLEYNWLAPLLSDSEEQTERDVVGDLENMPAISWPLFHWKQSKQASFGEMRWRPMSGGPVLSMVERNEGGVLSFITSAQTHTMDDDIGEVDSSGLEEPKMTEEKEESPGYPFLNLPVCSQTKVKCLPN